MFHITTSQAKYQPLQKTEEDQYTSGDVESNDDHAMLVRRSSQPGWIKATAFISVILNFVLIFAYIRTPRVPEPAGLVGLSRDIRVPIPHDNRTLDDELWDDPRYDPFVGMITVEDEAVDRLKLLPAQSWPWDTSKSMYFLYGFHSLHCVQIIRTTLIEYRDQKPLTWPLSHVTHCMHTMREDVLCAADDTPRYTGALNHESGKRTTHSGIGELRTCRNWDKLRQYAVDHSACYRVPLLETSDTIDRYKSCPDGSEPWKKFEN